MYKMHHQFPRGLYPLLLQKPGELALPMYGHQSALSCEKSMKVALSLTIRIAPSKHLLHVVTAGVLPCIIIFVPHITILTTTVEY